MTVDNNAQSPDATDHTLIIVQEDTFDDPDTYQVTKLEHPRDSPQVRAVHDAHRKLAEVAAEETGTRHRVVVEEEPPSLTQRHYEYHEEKMGLGAEV